jgi:protein gp37
LKESMGQNTNIEWCDHTFNPWRGCSKVSNGCKNCYAETLSLRNPAVLGEWGPSGRRVIAAPDYWKQPLKWDRDARAKGRKALVFCASLADVFEGPETMGGADSQNWHDVSDAREMLLDLIVETPNLMWLLLTKRPENIHSMFYLAWCEALNDQQNVAFGVSIEDQATANLRIPQLMDLNWPRWFISAEPLLGPVDFRAVPGFNRYYLNLAGGWVIAGGESGSNARPMKPSWARGIQKLCKDGGVPFFFKQWGEWHPRLRNGVWPDGRGNGFATCDHLASFWIAEDGVSDGRHSNDATLMKRVGVKAAGNKLGGEQYLEFPRWAGR